MPDKKNTTDNDTQIENAKVNNGNEVLKGRAKAKTTRSMKASREENHDADASGSEQRLNDQNECRNCMRQFRHQSKRHEPVTNVQGRSSAALARC